MIALGVKKYFAFGWNRLDFLVVFISLLEIILEVATGRGSSGLGVLRTFRLLRVLKLAQFSKTMRELGATISRSLGALANLTLILAIVIYMFAVMGFQLFAASYVPEKFPDDTVPRYNFLDFQHAFMIVFRVMCGEWIEPLWETMLAVGYGSIAYYFVTLIVANFIILNLFLALLLSAFESEEEQGQEQGQEADEASPVATQGRVKRAPDEADGKHDVVSEPAKIKSSTKAVPQQDGARSTPPPRFSQSAADDAALRRDLANGLKHAAADVSETGSDAGYITIEAESSSVGPKADGDGAVRRAAAPRTNGGALNRLLTKLCCGRHVLGGNNRVAPREVVTPRSVQVRSSGDLETAVGQGEASRSGEAEVARQRSAKREAPTASEKFGNHPTGLARARKGCYVLINHWVFDTLILLIIVWSSIMLCFENAELRFKPDLIKLLYNFNVFFCAVFVFEMVVKIVALSPKGYFTDGWNLLDFFIVVISVTAVALAGSDVGAVRSLRTLRALRPLRAVSRWESMKITVNSLLNSIPAISNVLLVCMLLWLIFAIMAVQFFGGKFYKCVDPEGELYPVEVINNRSQCLAMNSPDYTWTNSKINFDHVPNAIMALFQVATFEGWMEVMADSVDARGIDMQPAFEHAFYAYYFFVVFIIIGSFFALNLFIGVIIDNFNKLKQKYADEARGIFMSETQQRYVDTLQRMMRQKPQRFVEPPSNRFRRACFVLANQAKLEVGVMIVIGLNMITFMFDHYQMSDRWIEAQFWLNIIFTVIYTLEAVLKIVGWGKAYFRSGWNWFDFLIVLVSWVGVALDLAIVDGGLDFNPSILRVLRVLRVVRVLRLIKFAKGIQSLLLTLMYSAPALLNVATLLFLVMFIFAVIGMNLFGNVVPNGAINDFVNFRDFGNSMVLLFRLMTSAGWNDILDACMVQPPDCDPEWEGLANGNCGAPVSAQFYFVAFVLISFLIMINMYIAIILENLALAREREMFRLDSRDFEQFYAHWAVFDPTASQFIAQPSLLRFLSTLPPPLGIPEAQLQDVAVLNLPVYFPGRYHCLDVLQALTRRIMLVRGSLPHGELTSAEADLVDQQIQSRSKARFPRKAQAGDPAFFTKDRLLHSKAAQRIQQAFRDQQNRHRDRYDHGDEASVRRLHRGEAEYFEENWLG